MHRVVGGDVGGPLALQPRDGFLRLDRVIESGYADGFAFVRNAAIWRPFASQAASAFFSFPWSPDFAYVSTGTASRICVRRSFVSAFPAAAP